MNPRSKRIIRGVSVFVFLAALAWGISLFFPSDAEKIMMRLNEEVKMKEIMNRGSFDECDTLRDEDLRTACRNNIALANTGNNYNTAWCDKVDGTLVTKAFCEGRVLRAKVKRTGDLSVCAGAATPAAGSECEATYWFGKAAAAGDAALCANIRDVKLSTGCTDRILLSLLANGKTIRCDTMKMPSSRTDCELFIGLQSTDQRTKLVRCRDILDITVRNACLYPSS
jgi:hypothetical protein